MNDKMREMISLAIDAEEAFDTAQNIRRKAPMQAALLELMCSTGRVSAREAMHFTGASRQSLNALINAQLVVADNEEVFRRPEVWTGKLKALPELNREQESAYSGIKKLLDEPGGCTFVRSYRQRKDLGVYPPHRRYDQKRKMRHTSRTGDRADAADDTHFFRIFRQ